MACMAVVSATNLARSRHFYKTLQDHHLCHHVELETLHIRY